MESQTNSKGKNEITSNHVSYGTSVSTKKLNKIELNKVFEAIESDTDLEKKVEQIRKCDNKEERTKLKVEYLPYFNLGLFNHDIRNNENLEQTEYFTYDYDGLNGTYNECFEKAKSIDIVNVAFKSPSGDGLKVICRLTQPITNHKQFTKVYKHYQEHLDELIGAKSDEKCCDASRPCFFSYDPSLYLNQNPKLLATDCAIDSTVVLLPNYDNEPEYDPAKIQEIAEYLSTRLQGYDDWLGCGLALASLGEKGRDYFQILSQNPNYHDTPEEIDLKFNNLIETKKGTVGLGTLFYIAQKYGYDSKNRYNYYPFIELSTSSWSYYDKSDDNLHLGVAKDILKNILDSEEQAMPEKFNVMKAVFDVHNDKKIDIAKKKFNFFTPTEYMLLPKTSDVIDLHIECQNIHLLLNNLFPKPDELELFLNWLAGIMQTREKQLTAWVLKGSPGAGKNLFLTHVLKPIFGKRHVQQVEDEQLENQFNAWLQGALIIAFNEVAHDNATRNRIKSKIKAIITDSEIQINEKNVRAYFVENYVNCLFFSNDGVPVLVEQGDRRFNVVITGNNLRSQSWFSDPEKFIENIIGELQKFAQYLVNYQYDSIKAKTVMENPEKEDLINAGLNRFEEYANHLKSNDWEWFEENCTGFLYEKEEKISLCKYFKHKIKKTLAVEFFNSIYPDQKINSSTLAKKLRLYGIKATRPRYNGDREHYYEW